MKKMFLSLLVLAFASLSFAGNEGPQAAPPYPETVLAESTVGGGYPPPPGNVRGRSVQIMTDGTVVKVEWIAGEQDPKTTYVMTLPANKLATLNKLIQSIQTGELFDPNPEVPGCYDAPSFRHVVYKSGVAIAIAQTAACKQYSRENATASDAKVVKLLNAIEEIARPN